MTYMGQPMPRGFKTWTCVCGRLGLAWALTECPECGESRDRPQVTRPAKRRTAAKGGA